jgi:hypothetical protein
MKKYNIGLLLSKNKVIHCKTVKQLKIIMNELFNYKPFEIDVNYFDGSIWNVHKKNTCLYVNPYSMTCNVYTTEQSIVVGLKVFEFKDILL